MSKTKKELSTKRSVVVFNALNRLRQEICGIQEKDEKLLKAYTQLENAFENVLDVEAKYRANLCRGNKEDKKKQFNKQIMQKLDKDVVFID